MTDVRPRARTRIPTAVLIATTAWTAVSCADPAAPSATTAPTTTAWQEPASYVYTLHSREQVLWGSFRVTVRDGEVTAAVGLDADSRRALREGPGERIPTIGDLLQRLDEARREHADTAEADYAADGRPERITLDPDRNAIDDEAQYLVGDVDERADGRR